MHDVVDLRSDTLTTPTPEMREAMACAQVGDDVWGEDPTVQRLEALAARRTGKDAGLLVTSGTQGNLVSILAQTQPGGSRQEGVRNATTLAGIDLDSGCAVCDVRPRPDGELADRGRGAPDHGGHVAEGQTEQVVEHPGGPFGGAQCLKRDHEREAHSLVEGDPVGRVGGWTDWFDERLRQPGPDVGLALQPR